MKIDEIEKCLGNLESFTTVSQQLSSVKKYALKGSQDLVHAGCYSEDGHTVTCS